MDTFKCAVGDENREFGALRVGEALIQDIGMIARVPHPFMPERSVTLLTGITSRGVHGAALCFTDPHVRYDNERYLEERFGDTAAFCIVMNVPIASNAALPPSLWRDNTRLWEWSAEAGTCWLAN
jgi:hypothetical protein